MTGQMKVVCTGDGQHKERELARFGWVPVAGEEFDPRKGPLERWDEIKLFTGSHWSQHVEVLELPEGKLYRLLCPSCRGLNRPPIIVADSELHDFYYAANNSIYEVRVDLSLSTGII